MLSIKDKLETYQIAIYFFAVGIAILFSALAPNFSKIFGNGINPILALMLFVTFLQVPLIELGRVFYSIRFIVVLIITNFIAIPVFIAILIQFSPSDPLIKLGILLVLLTPCIDYVVTFSYLGKADSSLLLASTPILLLFQMILLPIYLRMFMGDEIGMLISLAPFIEAFLWLIVVPLLLSAIVQFWARKRSAGEIVLSSLSLLPVPVTAIVLFIIIATTLPEIGNALQQSLSVVPLYVAFAIISPTLGWIIARMFKLNSEKGRAISFSAGTRNSLVILPIALSIPNAVPILPTIIVTQTLVELVSELVYIHIIARLDLNT